MMEHRWRSTSTARPRSFYGDSHATSAQSTSHSSSYRQQLTKSVPSSTLSFEFEAPLIKIKLSNDVEGRRNHRMSPMPLSTTSSPQADIVLVTISGIGGEWTKHKVGSTFNARMKSFNVQDLYQRAGRAFSQFLSSSPNAPKTRAADSDFISINVKDSIESPGLSVDLKFHELYVEWNPETLAAVFFSLKIPKSIAVASGASTCGSISGCGEPMKGRFDSDVAESESDSMSESECESDNEFFDAQDFGIDTSYNLPLPNSPNLNFFSPCPVLHQNSTRPISPIENMIADLPLAATAGSHESAAESRQRPLKLILTLEKLEVNFNKDSRCRRLVKAQVDATKVTFVKKTSGGHRTDATLGNFTLSDNSTPGGDFYEQIIGLKVDRSLAPDESILTIAFETFERSNPIDGVRIDRLDGAIDNSDSFLSLKLSPMKFVYIQQLWLEIIDYFFTGILGDEVWGAFYAKDVSYQRACRIRSLQLSNVRCCCNN